jgi:hypothetical protein
MESIGKIVKVSAFAKASADKAEKPEKVKVKIIPDKHLHSPAHLLADELCRKFNDKKHFGFYLKMAMLYDHNFLRNLAGQVMEGKSVKTPGRLFAYLVKKANLEKKNADGAKNLSRHSHANL